MGKKKRSGREWRLRRDAGDWTRTAYLKRIMLALVAMGFALGALLATTAASMFGIDAVRLPVLGIVALFLAFWWTYDRKFLRLWSKGSLAERHVGHVIESALTQDGCVVAHSVYKRGADGTVGDIDHLVATPGRVWVVETKYAKVPKSRFPKVVSTITRNAEVVEAWLSPLRPEVIGCLALASLDDEGIERMRRSYEDGRVRVFNANLLRKEMAEAAKRTAGEADRDVAAQIWRLSGTRIRED